MPSEHPSQPAAPLVGAADDQSKELDSPESPELSASTCDEEERATVPAKRRAPKYLKVLVPRAACVVRVFDDEE